MIPDDATTALFRTLHPYTFRALSLKGLLYMKLVYLVCGLSQPGPVEFLDYKLQKCAFFQKKIVKHAKSEIGQNENVPNEKILP